MISLSRMTPFVVLFSFGAAAGCQSQGAGDEIVSPQVLSVPAEMAHGTETSVAVPSKKDCPYATGKGGCPYHDGGDCPHRGEHMGCPYADGAGSGCPYLEGGGCPHHGKHAGCPYADADGSGSGCPHLEGGGCPHHGKHAGCPFAEDINSPEAQENQ